MAKQNNKKSIILPSKDQIQKFKMFEPMIQSALVEMREFSKKKQDGILNPLKVKLINRLLTEIKMLLTLDPTIQYLDLLDEETLPQNSDAVLILGQYDAAMKQFKNKYHKFSSSKGYYWLTSEGEEDDED